MIFATDAAAKLRDQYNQEFQQLFSSIPNDRIILSNLNWYIQLKFIKLILKWFLCLALSMFLVYKVPTLNWNASAIGRIVLLNLFDSQKWEHLYETDCLLPIFSGLRENQIKSYDYDKPITSAKCDQCENIGKNFDKYFVFKYSTYFFFIFSIQMASSRLHLRQRPVYLNCISTTINRTSLKVRIVFGSRQISFDN